MMNKKGFAPLIIIVLIAGAILLISSGNINLADFTGSSSYSGYIEVPYIPNVECKQAGTSKSFSDSIATEGEWISDKLPTNTNEWSIRLNSEKVSFFSWLKQFEYYICPQKSILPNCTHKTTEPSGSAFDYNFGTISSDQFVWVQYQSTTILGRKAASGATFQVTYKPFILWRNDNLRGSGEVPGSVGCEIPADSYEWTNRLTAIFSDKAPGIKRELRVGESFNYISGTVTRMSEGNLESNGKYCIYSNGKGNLYSLRELKTASYTYQVVDVTKSAGSQDCCSGDNLPDKTCENGKWISTAKAQCSWTNPCEGIEWRRDLNTAKTAIKYECENGKCVAKTRKVECTKDTECSTNQRCELNGFTCAAASSAGGKGDERIPTGQAECEKKGWNWIPESTTTSGLIFKSKTIVSAHCEKPKPIWLYILILILIAVGLYFAWPYIFSIFALIKSNPIFIVLFIIGIGVLIWLLSKLFG